MNRIAAFDYGEKRIGVAVSDETKTIAQLRPFVEKKNKSDLIDLIREEGIEKVLIGLPLNMSGEETESAAKVKNFADWLTRQIDIAVEFMDERLSTIQATQKLKEQNIRGEKARGLVDSMSAQIILETYLERKNN